MTGRVRMFVCWAALTVLMQPSPSAAQSGVFRTATVSSVGSGPTGLGVGDADCDGNLDVVVTNTGGLRSQVAIATGRGDSVLNRRPPGIDLAGAPSELVILDLNGDETLDLALANPNESTVTVLLGLASAVDCVTEEVREARFFGEPLAPIDVGRNPLHLAAGDLNADGVADLVTANEESEGFAGSVSVLIGRGDGTFERVDHDSTIAGIDDLRAGGGTAVVRIGDVDADGNADILALNRTAETVSVFPGRGDGSFDVASLLTVGAAADFALADVDGDDALDYVAALADLNAVETRPGRGHGTFGRSTFYQVGAAPIRVLVEDVTGDGELDIVSANSRSQDVSVVAGRGAGLFDEARTYVADAEPRRLGSGDFNNDGRIDIAVVSIGSGGGSVAILRGRDDGTFDAAEDRPVGGEPTDLAAGDVDGDGWSDLIGVTDEGELFVFLGTPASTVPVRQVIAVGGVLGGVGVADFDRDLRLDVWVARVDRDDLIFLSGGPSGALEMSDPVTVGDSPAAIAIGDFNGDGRPDVATALIDSSQVAALLQGEDRNFGPARRSPTTQTGQSALPLDIAAIDANCDGFDDLVVANNAIDSVAVLLSNRDGTFGITREYDATVVGEQPASLTVGDFGGGDPTDLLADGRVDFAVGNGRSTSSSNSIRFFFGRCDGTFSAVGGLRAGFLVSAIVARDFTGDQIVDIGAVNQTSNVVRTFVGRGVAGAGDGTFAGRLGDTASRMPEVIVSWDHDGDGRYDLVSGNTDANANNVTVLTNCVRDPGCSVFGNYSPEGRAANRGDGNGDGVKSAADVVAWVAEVGDGDGRSVEDVERGSFAAEAGVEANGDGRVDAMDLVAIARRVFNDSSASED